MKLREQSADDAPAVFDLIKEAFKTAKVSCKCEAELTDYWQKSDRFVPELTLIAENNRVPIGFVMIQNNTETALKLGYLAPLCVAEQHRNRKVGTALMNEVLERAKNCKYDAVVLCGDPAYYKRFGFVKSAAFGLHHKGVPDEFVLLKVFNIMALRGLNAVLNGPPMEVTSPDLPA